MRSKIIQLFYVVALGLAVTHIGVQIHALNIAAQSSKPFYTAQTQAPKVDKKQIDYKSLVNKLDIDLDEY